MDSGLGSTTRLSLQIGLSACINIVMIDVASTSVSRFHKNKIGIKFIDVVYTYQKSFNFVSAFACYKQNVSWPRSIWPNLYAKQEVKVI